tara:strand:+ start:385 stop:1323 length:939 start_codon:yes stop_codon:yes gene_type:complete
MKILYVDPVVKTSISSNYHYYDGIINELIKQHEVKIYRNAFSDMKALLVQIQFVPDVVIFGLGWFNNKYFKQIKNISVPCYCFLFKPQNDFKQKMNFCKYNHIDLILTPLPCPFEIENITNIKTLLFGYGFDPETFKQRDIEKIYDIGFSGASHGSKHYPKGAFKNNNIRIKIGEIFLKKKDLNVFWSSSDDRPSRIPSYEEYAKTINSAKIWIATQAAFGDITPRFYEVAASGTLLFCEEMPKAYQNIFVDGETCVYFKSDLSDFEQKLKYYLSKPEEIDRITKNATESLKSCTWAARVEYLVNLIKVTKA